MKYLSPKKGFLGIDAVDSRTPQVIVVPFGLEKTVSYGGGTRNGPKEIIKASHQVELFDEELNKEPYKEIGIKTLKPFSIKNKINSALDQLSKINEDILSTGKFPLVFGGEHSITPGSIKPFAKKYDEITLLHFDAHADLRESYQGEKFSHASAIKRCLDYKNLKVVSFGIRNLSKEEMDFYNNNRDRVEIFWGKDKQTWDLSSLEKFFKNKIVYITFDVDGFDSSIMPATGTPEPGGEDFHSFVSLMKILREKNFIGADIVELSPKIDPTGNSDVFAAKIVREVLLTLEQAGA